MKISFLSSVLALSVFSTSLQLQAEENPQKPIIVTATRTAQTVDQALASVDVITREDIEQSQAQDVGELLRMLAGVDIARSGGYGSLTNVFMRGTNPNQTLFLIDGMRVASATTGTFPIENLDLNNIERIEIVRGPRSTQYGSDAIGGIIQIFTRDEKRQNYRVSGGSNATREASAGFSIGETTTLNLNLAYKQTDGISATNPNAGFFYDPDKDAYRNNSFNFTLNSPLTDNLKLTVTGWGSNAEIEFDDGTTDSINQSYMMSFNQQLTSNWTQKFSFGYSNEDLQTSSAFPSGITTDRNLFEWQHEIGLSDSTIALLGYSGYWDKAKYYDESTNEYYFNEKIDNNAVFAGLQYHIGNHDLMYTIRNDDHSAFGSHVTQQFSWGYKITPKKRLIATYGTAYRAPTANELYNPGYDFVGNGDPQDYFYAGNPNLQPEESTGGDISFQWDINAQNNLDLTYFHNDIDNLITYSGVNYQAENISQARTEGLEIKHDWRVPQWSLVTAITLQRAYDVQTDTDLIRRPREKLAMSLTRFHNSTNSTRAEVLASSSRTDGANGEYELGGYAIYNLATQIQVEKGLTFEGRIENLFDKQYEHVYGFNTPGFGMYAGFRYQL
jgi:vitamin B12 transporter